MLLFATLATAEPQPPTDACVAFGTGVSVSATTYSFKSASSSYASIEIRPEASVKFRLESGAAIEPELSYDYARTTTDGDDVTTLVESHMLLLSVGLRRPLAAHGPTELSATVAPFFWLGTDRETPDVEAAESETEQEIRQVGVAGGFGLERWLLPDLSLGLDLGLAAVSYRRYRTVSDEVPGSHVTEMQAGFDPSSRLVLRLYW